MPVTNYYTVDGEIVGESTGSTVINYATDALGSVTATLVGGQLQNTYAYKPYGALLAQTGSGADPRSQWVGSLGYRTTARTQSEFYVRARHYDSAPGRWTSLDPAWPTAASAFQYGGAGPTLAVDPSGLTPDPRCSGCTPTVTATPTGDNKCEVKKSKSGDAYDVTIYKCFKVNCATTGGDDTCQLQQFKTIRIYYNNHKNPDVRYDFAKDGPQIPVPCPGSEYFYDGPGRSNPKANIHDLCSKQTAYKWGKADLESKLPIKFEGLFTDRCWCNTGGDAPVATFKVAFKISKDGGTIKCSFIVF